MRMVKVIFYSIQKFNSLFMWITTDTPHIPIHNNVLIHKNTQNVIYIFFLSFFLSKWLAGIGQLFPKNKNVEMLWMPLIVADNFHFHVIYCKNKIKKKTNENQIYSFCRVSNFGNESLQQKSCLSNMITIIFFHSNNQHN